MQFSVDNKCIMQFPRSQGSVVVGWLGSEFGGGGSSEADGWLRETRLLVFKAVPVARGGCHWDTENPDFYIVFNLEFLMSEA